MMTLFLFLKKLFSRQEPKVKKTRNMRNYYRRKKISEAMKLRWANAPHDVALMWKEKMLAGRKRALAKKRNAA